MPGFGEVHGARRRRVREISVLPVLGVLVLPAFASPGLAEGDGDATAPSRQVMAVEPLRGLRASAAALLMQAPDGGALRVAAVVTTLPEDGTGDRKMSFVLELAGEGLATEPATDTANVEPSPEPLRLEIYAYLLDPSSAVLGHAEGALPVDTAAALPQLERSGVRIAGTMEVSGDASSANRLRLLVLDPASNRHGLATVLIARPGNGRWLPPPVLGVGREWLQAGLGASEQSEHSARPVLLPGQRYPMELPLRAELSAERSVQNLEIEAQPIGVPSQPRKRKGAAGEFALSPSRPRMDHGALQLVTEMPSDVAPGRYSLAVSLDIAGARWQTLPIEVWVAPPEADEGGSTLSWPALLRLTPSADLSEDVRRRKRDARAARYARLLILADTSPQAALDGLLQLFDGVETEEQRQMAEAIVHTLYDLIRASKREAGAKRGKRSGGEEDPSRFLVPILELHRKAFASGYTGGHSDAAQSNMDLVEVMAGLFSANDFDPEGAALVADTLAVAARDCEPYGLLQRSERLLLAGLEIAPEHRPSREMLAFLRERRGDLGGAVDVLEKLLQDEPKSRQLRIRLAVLQERRGQAREARRVVRGLIAERAHDWIEQLAWEVLGSVDLEQGEQSSAVPLLRRASAEYPGNQRLQILFANALDRAGRKREAETVLTRVELLEPTGPSPRLRYAELSPSGVVDSAQHLMAALPVLQANLSAAVSELLEP